MDKYADYSLGDWESCFQVWDELCEDFFAFTKTEDFIVKDEDDIIEYMQDRFNASDLEGRALVEGIWLDIREACKRLGIKGEMGDLVWPDGTRFRG